MQAHIFELTETCTIILSTRNGRKYQVLYIITTHNSFYVFWIASFAGSHNCLNNAIRFDVITVVTLTFHQHENLTVEETYSI